MSDIKWIKIVTDMFGNRKIRQIESLPDSDAILVIWLKLLCLAGNINDNGLIYFTKEIPYSDEMMASEFNKPVNTVRLALQTFEKFEMIEIINDVICISNWEKYQQIEGMDKVREQNRIRKQRQRERQRQALLGCHEEVTCDSHVTVTQNHATEIDKEKEIEKDIEKDITPPPNYSFLFMGKHEHVKITQKELYSLIKIFGKERTDLIITRLDNYIEETGKTYKSHYETMKRWIKEDMKKEQVVDSG